MGWVLVNKKGREMGFLGDIAVQRYVIAMEGMVKRTCINVFNGAWCVGECTNLIDLGCVDPRVGIDCLPDGKQSIHIPIHVTFWYSRVQIHKEGEQKIGIVLRVMEPENRVES